MIRLKGVRYRYPNTGWILKGLDTTIDPGAYLFVCGANGSGKSTLGYLFNGLVPHFFGGTLEGSVLINGVNTKDRRVSDLFSLVGLVFQNADAQLFCSTVEKEIAFGLESLGLSGREIEKRILEISGELHLEELLDRSPMSLSGGEKRLVSIASVLCLYPSNLILDEPYAGLDWEGTDRVRHAIRDISLSGKTVVVVEQRIEGFLEEADRCMVTERGRILLDGNPDSALAVLNERHLIPHYPERKKRETQGEEPLLAVQDLSYSVGQTEILRGVSFHVMPGETVAIVGKNGSGKTTLIKHFNGLLRPSKGEVFFAGERIGGKAPSERAGDIGLSFQNPNDQFFKNTVADELLVGPTILGKEDDSWLEEISHNFDLHGLLHQSPYRISEGEKKRVAVSSVLATRPKLLVLDEPTAGQDGQFREALAALLSGLEDRGMTTIIVTHDLEFAKATSDRWIVLLDGRVVADGSPRELLPDEDLFRMGALGRSYDERATAPQKP